MKSREACTTEVVLKPFSRRHLDATWRWVNTPGMKPLTGTVHPISRRGHAAWFRALQNDPLRKFFAVYDGAGRHIGNTGVKRLYAEHRRAELFIYIGEPRDRGRGMGTAATRLLTEYCFDEMDLHRVYVTVFSYNKGALASYGKAGFTREAVWRQHLYRHGRYHDVVVLSRFA